MAKKMIDTKKPCFCVVEFTARLLPVSGKYGLDEKGGI